MQAPNPKAKTTRARAARNGRSDESSRRSSARDEAKRALQRLDAIERVLRQWRDQLDVVARTGRPYVGIVDRAQDTAETLERIARLHGELCPSPPCIDANILRDAISLVEPLSTAYEQGGEAAFLTTFENAAMPLQLSRRIGEHERRRYHELSRADQRRWRACLMRFLDECSKHGVSPFEADDNHVLAATMGALPFIVSPFNTRGDANDTFHDLVARWPDERAGRKATSKWKLLSQLLKVTWGAHVAPGTLENEWRGEKARLRGRSVKIAIGK